MIIVTPPEFIYRYMKNLITKKEKDRIDLICVKYKIQNYTINPDGSIDVDGSVNLHDNNLSKFPLQFGNVTGDFNCSLNELISLQGSPHTVGGNCYFNSNKLTSLEGSPVTIGGDLMCGHNQLTSLSGSAIVVRGNFVCNNNKLTSLVGAPTTIGGDFNCQCNGLTTLVGSPRTIGGSFRCAINKLKTLMGTPITVVGIYSCSDNELISTYSGDDDIEIGRGFHCDLNRLPQSFTRNNKHYKTIIKYQRHFEIWNEDLTLNEENLNLLISEIEDGLE